ncbi:MAG: hypothetical protein NT023_24490 [Armatimonadetes bacterium]|nr:hypothetical protein [Armatimonadota bacterium]
MEYKNIMFRWKKFVTLASLLLACSGIGNTALAQGGGGGGGGNQDIVIPVSNDYLTYVIGVTALNAGGMGLFKTNPTTFGGADSVLLWRALGAPPDPIIPPFPHSGTWLYVRTDGGFWNAGRGWDYYFGGPHKAPPPSYWTIFPTVVGNHMEMEWSGGGTTTAYNPFLRVTANISFIHDYMRMKYTVTNDDFSFHTVELGFIQDINSQPRNLGSFDGPIRIPGMPNLYNEALLGGTNVPKYWETFATLEVGTSLTFPTLHSLRGVLRPNSVGSIEPTVPSYLAYNSIVGFGIPAIPGNNLATDYLPTPSIELGRPGGAQYHDAAIGTFYGAVALAPGQSKDYYIYIGQSTATPDFHPPLALSVEGPLALLYNHGDFAPTPFTISAYVQNVTDLQRFGGTDSGAVTLSLNLPKGLILAPDSRPLTQQIGNTTPGQEAPVSWRVVADGTVSGKLTYSVAVASSFIPSGKVVQRTVEVPAPTGFVARGANSSTDSAGTQRWQMISVPLDTGGDLPSDVLGLSVSDFYMKQFSSAAHNYIDAPRLKPGTAYWFKYTKSADQPISFVRPVDPNNPTGPLRYNPLLGQVQPNAQKYLMDLPNDWNQIANPYLYEFRFAEIQVQDISTQQIMTFTEAAIQGWVMPLLWEYDTSDPNPDRWAYRRISNFGEMMVPYKGYWIKVRRNNIRFLMPGVDTPGANVTRSASSATLGMDTPGTAANNWSLRLMAKGANSRDTDTFIGVHPKATDTLDNYKGEKPPAMNPSVSVDSIYNNTRLATDLRSPALGRKTWDILVRSVKSGEEVTLSWAGLRGSVPRDYSLVLVDKDANVRRGMSNTTSYTFKTGDSSTRSFQIVAEPTRGASRLRVLSLDVTPNATAGSRAVSSVTVNYGLSAEAQAQIVIRDGRGRTLRTLGTGTRAANGAQNSTVWDLRDQNGVSLPGGVYQIEVNATTNDGQRDRRVQPFLISR